MKKIIIVLLLCLIITITSVKASLPLSGKLIILDIGHGSKDMGTSYQNVTEKELNLQIAKQLEKELIKSGASVMLTRDDDYDLSTPYTKTRKRSDFNNRIKVINDSYADLYISIHMNYLSDSRYSGAQVFYYKDDNKRLAETIQKKLNTIAKPRSIKKMPDVYMYQYLKIKGVLIECGFLSNTLEREKLQKEEYQKQIAETITDSIIEYYH